MSPVNCMAALQNLQQQKMATHLYDFIQKPDISSFYTMNCFQGWKVPPRASTDESIKFRASCVSPENNDDERQDPVAIAKERLASLEAAIERRYLKPPLGTRWDFVLVGK